MKVENTTKLELMDMIMSQGYDLFSAGKIAEDCIAEVMAGPDNVCNYYIGKIKITIKKGKISHA